jgi:hypothetical protein
MRIERLDLTEIGPFAEASFAFPEPQGPGELVLFEGPRTISDGVLYGATRFGRYQPASRHLGQLLTHIEGAAAGLAEATRKDAPERALPVRDPAGRGRVPRRILTCPRALKRQNPRKFRRIPAFFVASSLVNAFGRAP